MREYLGHESQFASVEEHRLVGGKGDGIRLLEVNNGNGIMFTLSLDRAGDIARLYKDGRNLGFFAPCGYVAPTYYDKEGAGFLKSFTAGFLTTCGLTAVGSPCEDDGEVLPLHGNISHTPCENVAWWIDDYIHIKITVRDASLFGHKLLLMREFECPVGGDEIKMTDTVKNIGDEETPYMILYHFNMGYPLLSENSKVSVKSKGVMPRNERANEGLDKALIMEKPQSGFVEQCYYYDMEEGYAEIYNPDIDTKLSLSFDKEELPFFTEWKMMGKGEYVLGLEPGNCSPDGRDVMRKQGRLAFLLAGEEKTQHITIKIQKGQE